MAKKWVSLNKDQERLLAEHVAIERERCAKIADEHINGCGGPDDGTAASIAREIRKKD